MISVNELRIGNWVKYKGDYFCVKYLMPKCIIVADRGRGNVDFRNKELEPVPLSDEILLKCGFELMPTSEYTINTYSIEYFKIWNKNGDFSELTLFPFDKGNKY